MLAWKFPLIVSLGILRLSCLIAATDEAKIPAFRSWKGFAPGTYIIERYTYHGAKHRADGVEYRRTVLAAVGPSGEAKYQDYTSQSSTGPWKIASAHSDSPPGRHERLDVKTLPKEELSV